MILIAFALFALAIIAICIYNSCGYEISLYIGVIIIVLEIVVAICYAVVYYPDKYICERKAEMIGLEYKYDLFGGCFVRDDKGWFEYKQQRVIR